MDTIKRKQNILKAVLLLRKVNRYTSKEEQIDEVNSWFEKGYMTDAGLQDWISALKEPDPRDSWTQDQLDEYYDNLGNEEYNFEQKYCPSCTGADYGPSNPWDAPGMSVHDFI